MAAAIAPVRRCSSLGVGHSRLNMGSTCWCSTDRANAARRLLHAFGVRPEQVVEVRGFADQRLFNDHDRFDPRNRRVSVVVRFTA